MKVIKVDHPTACVFDRLQFFQLDCHINGLASDIMNFCRFGNRNDLFLLCRNFCFFCRIHFTSFNKTKFVCLITDYQIKIEYISTFFGTNLKLFCFLLSFLICFSSFIEAKPADLTYKDVPKRSEEIMQWHAIYKDFTPELAQRTLRMYVEGLDPSKSYLIESDVTSALSPSKEYLEKIVQDYKLAKFPAFEELFDKMKAAVYRRRVLEEQLKIAELPTDVTVEGVKNLDWAKSEDELFERLKKIKALQMQAVAKFEPEELTRTISYIEKYRKNREEEFCTNDSKLREKLIATSFMKAIASGMDSQTVFFTPTEAKQFLIAVQQRLFGIGVLMRDDIDGYTIIKLVEGGPAEQSKAIELKDKIIAIDGEPILGLDVSDVVEKIRGPEGTTVNLTILRNTEKLNVTIKRAEVVIKDARYEAKTEEFGDGVLVTLVLHSFYQDQESSSSSDLISALRKIQRNHKVKGILLDLRSNGGGLLTEAVAVAGMFLKKGIIVSIKDESGQIQHLRNLDSYPLYNGPLVVVINRESASAAEIVAQTLQDYGRALVVGDASSFGKGSFQIFTLNPGPDAKVNPKGEFKVTRGCYYTPSGRSPQLIGVVSDIEIPGPLTDAEIGERYSTYPLAASSIEPCFKDTLSDVPFFQRSEIRKLYLFDLEKPTNVWKKYLSPLKKNHDGRMASNSEYQGYLERARQVTEDISLAEELIKEPDYQGQEATQVLRDLVLLSDLQVKEAEIKEAA